MDFDFSEDQNLLKNSVDRLLADHYDFEKRRQYMSSDDGWSRELWRQYADMGLLGLPFAEEDGGIGAGSIETLIVMEAFGRSLVLEPYLATVILSGGFVRLGGSSEQKAALVPEIAEGKLLLAFAQAEKQSRYSLSNLTTRARQDGSDWVIDGEKHHVIHGDCADKIIVSARTHGNQRDKDGISLFIVDANAEGVSRRGYYTQDRSRSAHISFNNVRINAYNIIGEPGTALPLIENVVDGAIAALCAEAVGVMDCALDTTVEYLKVREQFGAIIGTFQALQHRAVDMLVNLEMARSMTFYATMMSEEHDSDQRSRALSEAKIQIGKSGKYVGEQAVQLHGGIGITDEYQIGHYFRRLTMIDLLFGDTHHHLAKLSSLTQSGQQRR